MPEHNQPTSTNPSEIEALIARLEDGQLRIEDQRLIGRLLRLLLTLIRVVEQKNTSISRLKRLLFGPGADKRTVAAAAAPSNTPTNDAPLAADESSELTTPSKSQIAETTPRRGHGRRAAADYTGARRVACADPELMPGDGCPQALCRGHLYETKAPAVFIRLEGRPIISATQYEQQVLRCSACAERFTAPLPAGVPAEKYDATADVAIALYKYGAGMPFYRQARLQAMVRHTAPGVGAIRAVCEGRRVRAPGLRRDGARGGACRCLTRGRHSGGDSGFTEREQADRRQARGAGCRLRALSRAKARVRSRSMCQGGVTQVRTSPPC
ncbi:MAG: hypothetical protein WKF84_09220 [Pyrinomonadaceae bacterium]